MFRLLLLPSLFFLYGFTALTPIETISSANGNGAPEISITPSGDAVGIWSKTIALQIEAAFFDVATALWSAPRVLGSGTSPQVGTDQNGNAIAIWVDAPLSTSPNQILVAHFDKATRTWSAPLQLSGAGVNSIPQIAVNANGFAIAVWVQGFPFAVVSSSFDATTRIWSAPVQLSAVSTTTTTFDASANSASLPQISLDSFNRGIAIWQNFSTGRIETIRLSIP
ncbi:MAG: hypothetical protein S4CHLAM123_15450 [Chlamydiales bacterium]|nr:hypothetical protein [Chlamydiales bacterium]